MIFSAHTASQPPPSRTPACSRASSRHASIAPRTMSAHGPLAWDAPELVLIDQSQLRQRQRELHACHEQSFTRLPLELPRPAPDPRARAPRSNRPGPGCSRRRTTSPRRSSGRRVPSRVASNQASRPSAPAPATLPPSFRKSPGRRGGHRPGRSSRSRDDASLRPRVSHDDRSTRPM